MAATSREATTMHWNRLSIQTKILLGISILVAGYVATIVTDFVLGAEREQRFGTIQQMQLPLALKSEAALFTFEGAVKSFADASMTGDEALVQESAKKFGDLAKMLDEMQQLALAAGLNIQDTKAARTTLERISELQREVFSLMSARDVSNRERLRARAQALADATETLRRTLTGSSERWRTDLSEQFDDLTQETRRQRYLGVGLAVTLIAVAGCVVFLIIQFAIVRPVRTVVDGLRENSEQVDSVSNVICTLGQTLATGANEQASSIEETSSTLEEISSMATSNAANSRKAKESAGAARSAVDSGMSDVRQMISAMGEIKTSSDNIARIVKAIDEIAFQTNILALNAAVEAARAGEAGAGFAVVADEVRRLAQRSAEAARETATLIDDSISKSNRGVAICDQVGGMLDRVNQKIRDVDSLVAEIAHASQEQSAGVEQVNRAAAQLDRLTQQNAATAQQSASTVKELAAQSGKLHRHLASLSRMIYGRQAGDTSAVDSDPDQPSSSALIDTAEQPGVRLTRSRLATAGRT